MRKSLSKGWIIVLTLFHSQQLIANELLIVVAKDSVNVAMNYRKLEHIFRRKTRINEQGKRWVPINLKINDPLRQAFSKKIFKQSPEDMGVFWNTQYFKGISPPYVVSSEEAVLRFIVNTPGAIGYISPCRLDDRVKVVMTLVTIGKEKHRCSVLGNL
jgi:hypothetical protein